MPFTVEDERRYLFEVRALGGDKDYVSHNEVCQKMDIVPFGPDTGELLLGRLTEKGAVIHEPIREARGDNWTTIDYKVQLTGVWGR